MNDRRYFYTDPLAAAWMAERFGMRFIRRSTSEEGTWDDDADLAKLVRHMQYVPNADISHFYLVHPDSMHLIEPRVGDIIKLNNVWEIGHPDDLASTLKYWGRGERIIQRNGTPFMWPESEAVESPAP